MSPAGPLHIRRAGEPDGAACAAIYEPYVRETAITFEEQPPDAQEMAARILAASRQHAWLVAEREGRVLGYAYGAPFHTRAAYRWACEVSVYVELAAHRAGVGRALYEELLPRLAARGLRVAIAGMTMPNEASVALHAALGFEPVGAFRRVGFKLGSWHDVAYVERRLAAGPDPPAEPR